MAKDGWKWKKKLQNPSIYPWTIFYGFNVNIYKTKKNTVHCEKEVRLSENRPKQYKRNPFLSQKNLLQYYFDFLQNLSVLGHKKQTFFRLVMYTLGWSLSGGSAWTKRQKDMRENLKNAVWISFIENEHMNNFQN